jgi:C1A family cysteine protease
LGNGSEGIHELLDAAPNLFEKSKAKMWKLNIQAGLLSQMRFFYKQFNKGEECMAKTSESIAMGWLPDYPDFRDYSLEHDEISNKLQSFGQKDTIKTMLSKVGVHGNKRPPSKTAPKRALPVMVDLRQWCSPIEDQEELGSCTANACVGVVEYFELRAFGKHIDASRLFLYKVTRNLMHVKGDTGAYLRSTMGGLVLFGVPPEEYHPYVISKFDDEPSAFCYAFAQNFQAINYYRLDPLGTTPDMLLNRIKLWLSAGLPSMFGFTVYSSISQASSTGKIPFPTPGERVEGGHAIAAVGYDDNMKIKNSNPDGREFQGAFLIRNSWGTGWGDQGYGWLPYEYVLSGMAEDWWSLLKNEWVDTGKFKV